MSVNESGFKFFSKKFDNEERTVDMSVLPPCESVLRLHCNCEKSKFCLTFVMIQNDALGDSGAEDLP